VSAQRLTVEAQTKQLKKYRFHDEEPPKGAF
jgi:hypothetical protein